MSSRDRIISDSPERTEELAAAFAASLNPGDWVGLSGPLGAGKTVWARGVARALGITEHIASPTYNLVHVYQGRLRLCHIDLYRVRSAGEMMDFGLDAYDDGETVILVEWADKLADFDLPFHWKIDFARTGECERVITVRKPVFPDLGRRPA